MYSAPCEQTGEMSLMVHILDTEYYLLVTHINQFLNFTLMLVGRQGTVPANRNYTR